MSRDWPGSGLERAQWWCLIIGIEGLGLLVAGALTDGTQFFQSYLFAYLFWLDIGLGCLALTMLHHLVGGVPGLILRRVVEAGAMTLPLLAVLFIPVALGIPNLYAWARPGEIAQAAAVQHKGLYLNVPFFVTRAVVYFVIWIGLAYLTNRWSLEQDRTADAALAPRMRNLSGPGMVLYALTVSLALIDWGMSLEPRWFSTAYGMLGATGQLLTGLAFAITVALLLAYHEPLSTLVSPDRLRDLSNLLLAGILLWAYLAFSQFLIIWAGNLPEEIAWYISRTRGGWEWGYRICVAVYGSLFGLLIMSPYVKRTVRPLMVVAAVAVLGHLADRFWSIGPAFHPLGLHVHWMDVAAAIGLGGIWLAAFVWLLRRRPLVPLRDPRFRYPGKLGQLVRRLPP